MLYAVGYKQDGLGDPYILKAVFMTHHDAVAYNKNSSNKMMYIKQMNVNTYEHWCAFIDAFSEGEPT